MLLLTAATSFAHEVHAGPSVVLIPLGQGDGLPVAAAVATAAVRQLGTTGVRARLGYPLPRRSPPEELTAKANRLLEQATQAREQADGGLLQSKAKAAMQSQKKLIKQGGPAPGYVQALQLYAEGALREKDRVEAIKALQDALLFDRQAPLDTFSPKLKSLHHELQSGSLATPNGTVKIATTPGALLFLNGRFMGRAKGNHNLPIGLYLIYIYRPGYLPWHHWYRVRPNQERELTIALSPDEAAAGDTTQDLRLEAAATAPGNAVSSARSLFSADEVVLVAAASSCSVGRCPIQLRWAQGSSWKAQTDVIHRNDARQSAEDLLRSGGPTPPTGLGGVGSGINVCTLHSQCPKKHRCINNRCVQSSPLSEKWWFWTIVGVVAAGAATGLAVGLTRPERPIIEIR
jgi:hypothetical protein